jgi:VanZ family protein
MKFPEKVRRHLEHSRTWWIFLVLWWVGTFVASSLSVGPPKPPGFEIPHLDKIMHFCWFAGGGFILALAIRLRRPPPASFLVRVVLPIFVMSLLGMLDEYRQSFTPGRSGNDMGDWLADTLGGTLGVICAAWAHRIFHSRH